jgi:dTDP-4-dehydrorhamnose reductase
VRLLVLGGDGMLGHELLRQLAAEHDVRVTLRRDLGAYTHLGLFTPANAVGGVDVRDRDALTAAFADFRPQAVVNAAAIVKQRPEAADPIASLEVNALFPHRLAALCRSAGARLVHLSTDCVFSGRRGGYREDDEPDPVDLYGRTKLLGEVDDGAALVLRTSIVGLELASRRGLVEWFLAQRGAVPGYRRARWSGLTTMEVARLVGWLLVRHPDLAGLWQVAAEPISKYELLSSLARALGRTDPRVEPDDQVVCDRSLHGERFAAATGYPAPSWDELVGELAERVLARERGAVPAAAAARTLS